MKRLTDEQSRLIALLRIFSCFWIFSIHYSQYFGEALPTFANEFFSYGQDGAHIFYMLSGFLLFYTQGLKGRKISRGGIYSII